MIPGYLWALLTAPLWMPWVAAGLLMQPRVEPRQQRDERAAGAGR